ncbi:hypothetical protein AFCDBAGC_1263 [Methylobacterium cerastii]|uniref:Secreted protein n=1 Tax=Methylobacterium cerastii TaxID=932741 RepID=A0ABQ4QDW1_9HYPH|nr:hypothetical protein AFCDBAGC_1263 [Methylobacterium cerastii]
MKSLASTPVTASEKVTVWVSVVALVGPVTVGTIPVTLGVSRSTAWAVEPVRPTVASSVLPATSVMVGLAARARASEPVPVIPPTVTT